jgi:hypothetical protein
MHEPSSKTLIFRCAPALRPILPEPIPAVQGLPAWFKAAPQKGIIEPDQKEVMTVKKCPPFIDAMSYGFLMPLVCDLKVENGEFSWDHDTADDSAAKLPHAPIDFHFNVQAAGTPFFEEDRFLLKFMNFWTIETPPGYSLLFTHPLNRPDLPFTTVTGLVDTDTYDSPVHFPTHWHDADFNGVLPKGTPVAQCIPVKREKWTSEIDTLSLEEEARLNETIIAVGREAGVYRREYRARKR